MPSDRSRWYLKGTQRLPHVYEPTRSILSILPAKDMASTAVVEHVGCQGCYDVCGLDTVLTKWPEVLDV